MLCWTPASQIYLRRRNAQIAPHARIPPAEVSAPVIEGMTEKSKLGYRTERRVSCTRKKDDVCGSGTPAGAKSTSTATKG